MEQELPNIIRRNENNIDTNVSMVEHVPGTKPSKNTSYFLRNSGRYCDNTVHCLTGPCCCGCCCCWTKGSKCRILLVALERIIYFFLGIVTATNGFYSTNWGTFGLSILFTRVFSGLVTLDWIIKFCVHIVATTKLYFWQASRDKRYPAQEWALLFLSHLCDKVNLDVDVGNDAKADIGCVEEIENNVEPSVVADKRKKRHDLDVRCDCRTDVFTSFYGLLF